MNKEYIEKIEKHFGENSLTDYIYHILNQTEDDDLFVVEPLSNNSAGLVLNINDLSIETRRDIFLKIWKGCERIANDIKSTN